MKINHGGEIPEPKIESTEKFKSDIFGKEKSSIKITDKEIEMKQSEKSDLFGKEKTAIKIKNKEIEDNKNVLNENKENDNEGASDNDRDKHKISDILKEVVKVPGPEKPYGESLPVKIPLLENAIVKKDGAETEKVEIKPGKALENTGRVVKTVGTAAEVVGTKIAAGKPEVGAPVVAGGVLIRKVGEKLEKTGEVIADRSVEVNVPVKYRKIVDVAERLKLVERKEKNEKAETINHNRIEGRSREENVSRKLSAEYPESKGYSVLKEVYLRDKDGKIARDPETGEARRIDFVVIKDGQTVKSVEVTSQTASKENQMAKENRIKENGGTYIKDQNGNLVKHNVDTNVERYA